MKYVKIKEKFILVPKKRKRGKPSKLGLQAVRGDVKFKMLIRQFKKYFKEN